MLERVIAFTQNLRLMTGGTGQEPGIDSGAESPDDLNTEQSEPEKRFYAFMRETLLFWQRQVAAVMYLQ